MASTGKRRIDLKPREAAGSIPPTLTHASAPRFWTAVILTGVGAGIGGAALTTLLYQVQHFFWPPATQSLLDAANAAPTWHRVAILVGAGILTGLGQLVLVRLTTGNGIEITTALWFHADRLRPKGWWRLVTPTIVFGLLGATSIWFPQLLGNGKDVTQLAFTGQLGPILILVLLALKPLATVACLGSGAPGGLFTPSLTLGALLGGALGYGWTLLWPGTPLGLFAVIGAGAVLAATTQGPISAAVLMIELTGHDHAFVVPMLIAIVTATLVARTIDPRSIYDARLTDEELAKRQVLRQPSPH